MPDDLLSLQRDVAEALRGGEPPAQPWFTGDADQVAQRLSLYRTNVRAAATKALAAAYPVLQQVVGEAAFEGLARTYQRERPSTSGNLYDHGAEFAEVLAGHEAGRDLPYLPDLARLEWAVHRAHGAADALPLDPKQLARVAPERLAALRFQWAAGTALIASSHPIVRIWTIHQPGFDGEFGVDWSAGECACVARDGWAVQVRALPAGEAAFIEASLAGLPLGVAADHALAVDAAFDLGGLLARTVAAAQLCGFDFINEN